MKLGKGLGKKKKPDLIVESKKTKLSDKEQKLQAKLADLEISEIDALFEAGRISEEEYESIIDLKKKQKSRKKSEKEKFEERIRCDNNVITKIINLGRRYRVEDLLAHGKFEEARKADVNKEFLEKIENQEYVYEDRVRDKTREERLKEKYLERNSSGRGKERDTR